MASQLPPELTVRFVAEQADVEAVYIRAWVDRGSGPAAAQLTPRAKRWWTVGLVASMLGAVGVFVTMAMEYTPASGVLAAAAIATPLVCAAMLSPGRRIRMPLATEQRAREAARGAAARISYGTHVMRVSREGFSCATDYYEVLYRWPCIIGTDSTVDALYVRAVGDVEFRIPLRSFGDTVRRGLFIDAINGWIALRGADMESRFVALARVHGLVCLSCGYSLAELTKARCPECGRELTLDDYPTAEYVLPDDPAADPGAASR